MNDYADYIIRNGRFYTEESHNPQAEVVAIKGEDVYKRQIHGRPQRRRGAGERKASPLLAGCG